MGIRAREGVGRALQFVFASGGGARYLQQPNHMFTREEAKLLKKEIKEQQTATVVKILRRNAT